MDVCDSADLSWHIEGLKHGDSVDQERLREILRGMPATSIDFLPDELSQFLEKLRWLPEVQHILVEELSTDWFRLMVMEVWVEISDHPEDFREAIGRRVEKNPHELKEAKEREAVILLAPVSKRERLKRISAQRV